jgi:hypothetical protein
MLILLVVGIVLYCNTERLMHWAFERAAKRQREKLLRK